MNKTLIYLFFISSLPAWSVACDLNNDGKQGSYEAIHSLNVLAGKSSTGKCDSDFDGKEGLPEAIKTLRIAANIEPNCIGKPEVSNTNTGFGSTYPISYSSSVQMIENNSSFPVTVTYTELSNTSSAGNATIEMVSPMSFTLHPSEVFELQIDYATETCPASAEAQFSLSINAVPESGCFYGLGSGLQVNLSCTLM